MCTENRAGIEQHADHSLEAEHRLVAVLPGTFKALAISYVRHVQRTSTHPLVVIHQTAPVQHVHHGLKAEDGLLVHFGIAWNSECTGR